MLSSDSIIRITNEETLGLKPRKKDNKEEKAFRAEVKKDIKKIRDAGGEVQIPHE